MPKLYVLLGVVTFCLFVYSLVEIIQTADGDTRHLPKVWWLLLVLFFPFVGSIAWLAVGRPDRGPRRSSAYGRSAPDFPEYDRPGRAAAADPARDAEFLRQVRARAEEQRRRHQQQQRREREDPSTPGPDAG